MNRRLRRIKSSGDSEARLLVEAGLLFAKNGGAAGILHLPSKLS
jgi:hypothetical protein